MNDDGDEIYLNGNKLYGNDMQPREIEAWFKDEEEGYANLGYLDSETTYYPYHGMNDAYGWSYLEGEFPSVLGFGSAFASEFEFVSSKISNITVIEPAKKFWRPSAFGKPLRYVPPDPQGQIRFPNDEFDLITVFGVLHHIPNVSYVFQELVRVLKPGGMLLLRAHHFDG
jgi:SAM-dependent methyltransferase